MISSNWHHISCRFEVIAAFLSPFRRLTNNVRCSSWADWKARSGLPITVNWTFFAGCFDWVLRAKTDRKSAISLQRGHFYPKFQVDGVALPIIFARLVRPMNALQLRRWQLRWRRARGAWPMWRGGHGPPPGSATALNWFYNLSYAASALGR